ncbi:MAG: 3-phosphoshikimate 1-carboxyvinyltransferase [Phycisphaerae bacterium]|nr:3-phosphoshikimate 1-carboxyvinyltransferase [Gemmatimonadaceae bacterium]
MTQRLHVSGTIRVPGDKSISHRSLMFAALAPGPSRVRGILDSADVRATARVLTALGAPVPAFGVDMTVIGVSPDSLISPMVALDCANSGTTSRLMMGVLAGLDGRHARFEGDASLSNRPMRRISQPLSAMGARVDFEGPSNHFGLPLTVHGARLNAIVWQSEHASAQIKSAILLAALMSGVEAEVMEPSRSRDHTELMLAARGVGVEVDGNRVRLPANQRLSVVDVEVPADPSSAAFFAALAALAQSGEIQLTDVCLNPTRTGAVDVLRRMGANIRVEDTRVVGGEQIGTIVVAPGELNATTVEGAEIPTCIDELPLIACVAARAHGETRITGASELRVKESDRITAVVNNLRAIGADAEELPDGMIIRGSDRPFTGKVATHGDHRLAMAFGILAAMPGNDIEIDDPACVDVSFPSFWRELAKAVGPVPAASFHAVGTETGFEAACLVVAIDGPAASGKSSTAQWVADKLGVRHVDSGAFYRAITALGIRSGVFPERWTPQHLLSLAGDVKLHLAERSVVPAIDGISDEMLRERAVTEHVSRVAQMPNVRAWVNERVREAASSSDVVVDGRDIGTSVFPDAALKVFLIADPWERARRRLIQRFSRRPTDNEIAAETEALVERDARDATQSAPARDAITIDTTALTQEEQVDRIVSLARAARERRAPR